VLRANPLQRETDLIITSSSSDHSETGLYLGGLVGWKQDGQLAQITTTKESTDYTKDGQAVTEPNTSRNSIVAVNS
jgi:hypothetical protein